MPRYVEQSLAADESILVAGRYPTVFWIGAWLTLALLGPLIIGLLLFVRWAVHMRTTEFAVTDRRVILKRGLFGRSTQEIAIDSVEGVELRQSMLGRMFGFGRLRVRGTGEALIALPHMADPITFRTAIETGHERANEVHIDAASAPPRIAAE